VNAPLIPIALSGDTEGALSAYLRQRLEALRRANRELFEDKYPRWRRLYEARPLERERQFPFYRASNLVVPIIAIHCDTLLARVMSAILRIRPLWFIRVIGKPQGDPDAVSIRAALEGFLNYVGLEPWELDLFRVCHEWFGEAIRYGTSTVKIPWDIVTDDRPVPTSPVEYVRTLVYEGPRPEKIPFDCMYFPASSSRIEDADFKAHRRRMKEWEVIDRFDSGAWNEAYRDIVLSRPDRSSPDVATTQSQTDLGVREAWPDSREWDIYECWFRWRMPNGMRPRVIVTYHLATGAVLRAIHNFYEVDPFVTARLFYRDDSAYGYGFVEMLEQVQEEISTMHNERRDNATVANTRVWRVNPDSKLHEGFRIYPGAMLPANKDEIEPLMQGQVAPTEIQEEELALSLAERRTGVSPPMQGFGAGVQAGRRGIYTAMGTLSVMQEGNRRTDLNIADLRYAFTKLGRIVLRQYAEFGIRDDLLRRFGSEAEVIRRAMQLVRTDNIEIAVAASTASINKEIEKQNDILLMNLMDRHYSMVTQMLQAISVPMTPPAVKDYLTRVVRASDLMMREVLRHFDYDDPERFIPTGVPDEKALSRIAPVSGVAPSLGHPGVPGGPSVVAGGAPAEAGGGT
jgi:hypothetical protein